MRPLVVAFVALTLVGACVERASRKQGREAQAYTVLPMPPAPSVDRAARAPAAADESEMGAAGAGLELPGARDILPNLIIRTGTASLQVDSLDRAVALVRALARRVGGFVAGSATQAGQGQLHSASLEIRMPVERFDEALEGLRPIGKLESVNITAEDVGEEYVDIDARMTNARHLEARLIDLVAHRTGKLADVLSVERELARVREEMERFEGRLRYLRSRSAVSTLTLTVHEPIPVVDRRSPNVVAEAVRQAWRNFVLVLAFAIQSLGVVLPLGLVAIAIWWALHRGRRPPPQPANA